MPIVTVATSIATPAPLQVRPLTMGDWSYFRVNQIHPEPLWVSVAPFPGALSDIELYVRRGAIPTEKDYDYMNCNVPNSCGYARIINLNQTAAVIPANYTFFIGVYGKANTTFGIWFSSTCPPQCINQDESGVCVFSGGNVGQCQCADGFSGLDCTLSNGNLPTQYIVLIIIASLVVLSALIGFFAWAYMQRKREGYSSLS